MKEPCPRGPPSARRSGQKRRVSCRRPERNAARLGRLGSCTPLERVCGSKYPLTGFLREPLVAVTLGLVIVKRPRSFLAPHVGHIDSNGVDGRGKNLFCSFKRNQKKERERERTPVLRFLRPLEIAPEKDWVSAFLSSAMMLRVVSPTCDDVCQGQSFLKMFQACGLPRSFFKLRRREHPGESCD